jgi:hypothetical protein
MMPVKKLNDYSHVPNKGCISGYWLACWFFISIISYKGKDGCLKVKGRIIHYNRTGVVSVIPVINRVIFEITYLQLKEQKLILIMKYYLNNLFTSIEGI